MNETTLARIPTIVKLRALFDNYNLDTEVSESVTQSNQQEEWEFLEKVIDTPVMKLAMKYLNGKSNYSICFLLIINFFLKPGETLK